jgi:hypothetical protein
MQHQNTSQPVFMVIWSIFYLFSFISIQLEYCTNHDAYSHLVTFDHDFFKNVWATTAKSLICVVQNGCCIGVMGTA